MASTNELLDESVRRYYNEPEFGARVNYAVDTLEAQITGRRLDRYELAAARLSAAFALTIADVPMAFLTGMTTS